MNTIKLKYGDLEFELKELNLSILNKTMPVIMAEQKLRIETFKDIDTNIITKFQTRLAELDAAIQQIEALKEKKTKEKIKQSKDLQKKKSEIIKEMNENTDLKTAIETSETLNNLVYAELASNSVLMAILYNNVLIGDVNKLIENCENIDIFQFNLQMLYAFFFNIMILNQKKTS